MVNAKHVRFVLMHKDNQIRRISMSTYIFLGVVLVIVIIGGIYAWKLDNGKTGDSSEEDTKKKNR